MSHKELLILCQSPNEEGDMCINYNITNSTSTMHTQGGIITVGVALT